MARGGLTGGGLTGGGLTGLPGLTGRAGGAAGMFVMVADPAVVEIAGLAGFGFVVVDTEHGPASTETVEHLIRAADAVGTSCLVRVPARAYHDVQRALDAGAAGIVAPHITSRVDAEALVAAVRFPPEGRRGFAGTSRGGRYGFVPRDDVLAAGGTSLAVAQIEDAEALDRLEEIVATPGLSAALVGPSDLSVSLGVTGAEFTDRLSTVLDRLAGLAAGRDGFAVGCFAPDADEGARLLNAGVDFVVLSSTSIIATAIAAEYRRLGVRPA